MDHDEHSSRLRQLRNGEPPLFKILCSCPLKVLEVVGVIHHAATIRILIINSNFHVRCPQSKEASVMANQILQELGLTNRLPAGVLAWHALPRSSDYR